MSFLQFYMVYGIYYIYIKKLLNRSTIWKTVITIQSKLTVLLLNPNGNYQQWNFLQIYILYIPQVVIKIVRSYYCSIQQIIKSIPWCFICSTWGLNEVKCILYEINWNVIFNVEVMFNGFFFFQTKKKKWERKLIYS